MLKCLNDRKGFTLVEALIAMAILVIMMGAVTAFFVFLYREQAADLVRIERINIANQAIKTISFEIRKINRGEDGSYPIESAQNQSLIFFSDIDNDGLTEKITYFLSGTELKRTITEPTGDPYQYVSPGDPVTIVKDVRNGTDPIFKYYDENYTGSQSPLEGDPINVTEIKLIGINLDINSDNRYLTKPLHIETKVHPRNLKNFN